MAAEKTFYVQCGAEKALITDREKKNAPPLSFYFRVAAEAAGEYVAAGQKNAQQIITTHFHRIMQYGSPRSQFSEVEILSAALCMFMNQMENAKHQILMSFNADPSNIYSLSLLSDILYNDQEFKSWVNNRIKEVNLWSGNEDFTVIGDSHAYSFCGVARCKIDYVGSLTMHRIGRDGFAPLGLKVENFPVGHNVVLSFGEIDARIHVVKQQERNGLSFETIIKETVDRYIAAIEKAFEGRSDIAIIVMGLPPPIHACDLTPDWVYGSDQDRQIIQQIKNLYLEEKCRRYGLKFLDMHQDFQGEDGFINKKFWKGDHHICARHYSILEHKLRILLSPEARIPMPR